MKKINTLTLALTLLFGVTLFAQQKLEVEQVKMTITGTSSLHEWVSDVTEIKVDGQFNSNQGVEGIKNLKVEIPVLGIKSTKGATMDKKTWKALKSEEHPLILYKLNKLQALQSLEDGTQYEATGNLTIAGVTTEISMTIAARPLSETNLEIKGSKALKMSDFGIKPPTALFGTLKTGNDIIIGFRLVLKDLAYN